MVSSWRTAFRIHVEFFLSLILTLHAATQMTETVLVHSSDALTAGTG